MEIKITFAEVALGKKDAEVILFIKADGYAQGLPQMCHNLCKLGRTFS